MLKLFKKPEKNRSFSDEALAHADALYATALSLTRQASDAEDLVQDTFVKALRFSHRYEAGTNIKAWLFKIMMNTFINRYRRIQRDRDLVLEAESQGSPGPFVSDAKLRRAADPETYYFESLVSDTVIQALDKLPTDFRTVVILADLQDFTYQEIAEVMSCPVGTVMSRLYRGRRMLQKLLYQHAIDEGIIPAPAETSKVAELAGFRARAGGRAS